MSNQVQIQIDGQTADYKESESLPVSLGISTDKFLEVVGTGGIKVDNPAKQLIFPATLRNQEIFEALDGLAEAAIRINGATIFDGNGHHKLTSRNGEAITGYSMALSGGARDLFASLGGKTLRGLELGNFLFDGATIDASQVNGFDDGYNAVVAPVLYGYTGAADNDMQPDYLRPHIYFAAICQAIWEELRVSVESTFFGTDYFKRFVHLFGVGDKWNAGGSAAAELLATNTAQQPVTGTPSQVLFQDETSPPNQDTGNIWALAAGSATAGTWTFSGEFNGVAGLNLEFVILGLGTWPINPAVPWSVGPIFVPSTTTFYVLATPINPAVTGTIDAGAKIAAIRQATVALGSTVKLSTCLPGEKITSFLAGISHLFNLAWYYDNVRRVLHVEPRFDYELSGTTYEGFYKRLAGVGVQVDWSAKFGMGNFTRSPYAKPFNDWLILNNKAEESPWYEEAADNGTTEGIPYLGARYDFGGTGKDGKTELNPYFENLLIVDAALTPLDNVDYMPAVVPEPEDGATQLPDPTYETGPKYAWYAGVLGGPNWKYNGSVVGTRPTLVFKPQPFNTYSVPYNVAFCDYNTTTGALQYLPGLMRTFYPQWLVILDRGEILEGDTWLRFDDIQPGPDLFRQAKLLVLNQQHTPFIFLGVEKFQPLKLEASKGTFIELVQVRDSDLANLTHNLQNWFSEFRV